MNTYTLHSPPGSCYLVPGDIHFPVQDEAAMGLMRRVAEALGVTDLVLPGDVYDVFGLSSFPKEAKQMFKHGRLIDEVDASRPFREWTRRFRTVTFLPGNHEHRIVRLQAAMPGLAGTPWWRFLELDTWPNLYILDFDDVIRIGPLQIEHGNKLKGSSHPLSPAAAVLAQHPHQLTLFGHTHRAGSAYRTRWNYDGQELYGAWNTGTMVDFQQVDYEKRPNWQQAFTLVDVYSVDGKTMVDPEVVVIHRDSRSRPFCRARGRVFR
jgi:hypothetical protein